MITRALTRIDQALEGAPDELLSIGLIALGGLAIAVALFARPKEKAALFGWYLFP